LEKIGGLIMPRLVKSVEKRPEEATVINWTVPVYIKNGEDYYKVCFDIKRKPLSDGTLPMTESEKTELAKLIGFSVMFRAVYNSDHLCAYISPYHKPITFDNVKAILWLAERFDLTSNN
jgi:hypothetical protein